MGKKQETWEGPFYTCECCGNPTLIKPVSTLGTIPSKHRELSRELIQIIYTMVLGKVLNKEEDRKTAEPVAVCDRRMHRRRDQKSLYIVRLSRDEFVGPFCRLCLLAHKRAQVHRTGAVRGEEIYMVSTTPRAIKQLLVLYNTGTLGAARVEDLGSVASAKHCFSIDPAVQLF